MSQLKTLLKFLVPLLIFSFFVYRIGKDWSEVSSTLSQVNLIWFIPAAIALVPVLPFSSLAWHLVVASLGGEISFKKSFRLWIISNAARFIPGTIWQFLGRVYLAEKEGITRPTAISALVLEMVLAVLTAGLITLVSLPSWPLTFPFPTYIFLLLLPFLFLAFYPNFLAKIFFLAASVLKKEKVPGQISIPPLVSAKVVGVNVFAYLGSGVAIFCLMNAFSPMSTGSLLPLAGIYTFSWLAGALAFFIPSGLGVVEFSLASLLSFWLPFSVASVVAILLRVITTVLELSILILVFFLLRTPVESQISNVKCQNHMSKL